MRLATSLFIVLCINMIAYGQMQPNYAQELYNLLMTGRNFEAKEYKLKHQDHLPADFDLVYNMHMALAFNQPDSVITYFEEFLSNPQRINTIGPIVSVYFIRLCETYEAKQQFEKSISTVEKHLAYLKENPYSLPDDAINKEIEDAKSKIMALDDKQKKEPARSISWVDKNIEIKLKEDNHIRFDAYYNGQLLETYFDTGVTEYCILEKDLADKIGVKYILKQDSIRNINGKPFKAMEGYLDSIEIMGIKLYNIPVGVLFDKFIAHIPNGTTPDFKQNLAENLLKSKQVIFGLPAMKMLGRFEFDWKSNTLVIPHPKVQESNNASPRSNIMFIAETPYINMKINSRDFVGFLDMGSDHNLFLTYSFFFKSNSDYIKNDTQNQPYSRIGFLDIQENIERQRVENPTVEFGGKKINPVKLHGEIFAVANINNFDGEVGLSFFKNTFSKTIFDFNSMTIECQE
ncbi:MAG: aspartyl protease family protein [Sphingobacterium sp.]